MARGQIHKFYLNNKYIVLDVNSGAVHMVDRMVNDVLDHYGDKSLEEIVSIFDGVYDKEAIEEAYGEINYLVEEEMLYSPENDLGDLVYNQDNIVKAMCLHVAHDCNLKCAYCFASQGNFKGRGPICP